MNRYQRIINQCLRLTLVLLLVMGLLSAVPLVPLWVDLLLPLIFLYLYSRVSVFRLTVQLRN